MSLFQSIQNESGAHPVSYPMATRGSFPEVVQPRLKGDHTPHLVSRLKMRWGNTSTPHTSLHICTKATIHLLFFFSAVQLITQFSKPTRIFYTIWTTEV